MVGLTVVLKGRLRGGLLFLRSRGRPQQSLLPLVRRLLLLGLYDGLFFIVRLEDVLQGLDQTHPVVHVKVMLGSDRLAVLHEAVELRGLASGALESTGLRFDQGSGRPDRLGGSL